MKKLFFLSITFFTIVFSIQLPSSVFAQGVGINSSGNPPDPSAILDVSSTTKGQLLPRMTTAQRDSISNPADGLIIFNTSTNCIDYRANGLWLNLCGTCNTLPTTANAGPNQTGVGGTSTTLTGNTAIVGTGVWSFVSGPVTPTITSSTSPTSTVTGLTANGNYIFQWTISNMCGSSSSQVTITKCTYASGSATFNYIGSSTTWNVPSCVSSITVDIKGAQGSTGRSAGGFGGRVQATLAVTPGQQIQINVGGQGGFNGGGSAGSGGCCSAAGGGGASDIRTGSFALSDRLVVAAGGGGGGSNNNGGSVTVGTNKGGNGGGLTGSSGNFGNGGGGYVATGGTQSAGGTGGGGTGWCSPNITGFDGSWGVGGTGGGTSGGGSTWGNGGGGGGGYFGGGGGGVCDSGQGGAGGSSYTTPGATSVTHTAGYQSGNGQIIISW